MSCNGLTQSTFQNCSVVGASISLGLGQSPSSLSLDLVEELVDTNSDGTLTDDCDFAGYAGSIGEVYTVNVGGLLYHGMLSDHKINIGSNGRTINATLNDGRDFLRNVRIITGKYYGPSGVYETCSASVNTLNVLYESEPAVNAQFVSDGCSPVGVKKCDITQGFMASGRDKTGMPAFSIMKMFVAADRKLTLPLSNQQLRINLDDLFLKMLEPETDDPTTPIDESAFLSKGLFIKINQNSISVLDLVENICKDIACDFFVFIRPYSLQDPAVTTDDYEIVVKVVDRSVDVTALTSNPNILRDYVRTNYLADSAIVNGIVTANSYGDNTVSIDYGQELTNETTKKIVFGDSYRYFVEVSGSCEGNNTFHFQQPSFKTGWNTNFGYAGSLFGGALPGSITGVAPSQETPVDTNPQNYLSLLNTVAGSQSNEDDLVNSTNRSSFDFNWQNEENVTCEQILGHRIFQVLGEEISTDGSATDISSPLIHKLYLTNFSSGADGNTAGFTVQYSTSRLKKALKIKDFDFFGNPVNTKKPLTHEELLMSANFDLYKTWVFNHGNSFGGYFASKIYGKAWLRRGNKTRTTFKEMTDKNFLSNKTPPNNVTELMDDRKFEQVQQYVKKIYDDYYGKEFAVLLDRRDFGNELKFPDSLEQEFIQDPVTRLASHDVCLARSYDMNTRFGLGGYKIGSDTIPLTSSLDEGHAFCYKINGDETNYELSDQICDGAWFAGPNVTGVMGLHYSELTKFQNSDSTIGGFVNLGHISGVCRSLGGLGAILDSDFKQFKVEDSLIKEMSHCNSNKEQMHIRATFDKNLYFCKLDSSNLLSYADGGDHILVRFSIPKIPLSKQKIRKLSDTDQFDDDNNAQPGSLEAATLMFDGDFLSQDNTEEHANVLNSVFDNRAMSRKARKKGAQANLSMFNYLDMNQFALFPRSVAIPFESKTQIYGPFSFSANYKGGVDVEETDLSPWQYCTSLKSTNFGTELSIAATPISASWQAMVNAGQQAALHGTRARLFQEKATLELVGIPSIDLNQGLELAANAGAVLSNVNITYGAQGATTQLNFSTYSRQFGETAQYIKNATRDFINSKRELNNKIQSEKNRRLQFRRGVAQSITDGLYYRDAGGATSNLSRSPSSESFVGNEVSYENSMGKERGEGSAGLLFSAYNLSDDLPNNTGGQDIIPSGAITSVTGDSSSDDSPTPLTRVPQNETGNAERIFSFSQIKKTYSDEYIQPYYSNLSINSLDALYLPASISGGLAIQESDTNSGTLPRYVVDTGTIMSGMKARPFSSVPPLMVNIGEDNHSVFDLKINTTHLNPYCTSGIMTNSWDSALYNESTQGFIVQKIAMGSGIEDFITGDSTLDEEGDIEFSRETGIDFRFNAMRGPLVLQAWGYDTNGKPIPNANDSPIDTESGIFRDTGLKDAFMQNWLGNPATWPVAPVDLRFDRNRGVWVAPTQNKIMLARMKGRLDSFSTQTAQLVNASSSGVSNDIITPYYSGTSLWGPSGEDISQDVRNATVTVHDYLGMSVAKDELVYLYYDDGKYIVMNQKSSGGSATLTPAKVREPFGNGGQGTAAVISSNNNFSLPADTAGDFNVKDYLKIVPREIEMGTPIFVGDIGEDRLAVLSIGLADHISSLDSYVQGLDFNAISSSNSLPDFLLGLSNGNLVRFAGVTACQQTIS